MLQVSSKSVAVLVVGVLLSMLLIAKHVPYSGVPVILDRDRAIEGSMQSELKIPPRGLRQVHPTKGQQRKAIKSEQQKLARNSTMKTIVQIDSYVRPTMYSNFYHELGISFDGCEYTNCVVRYTSNPPKALGADLVLMYLHFNTRGNASLMDAVNKVHLQSERENLTTAWLVNTHEPPSYGRYKWHNMFNSFDGAANYQRESMVYRPYGRPILRTTTDSITKTINYAANKTKGAFAYVSHCTSKGFDRLKLMRELGKYIDVDIYGKCTDNVPCRGRDYLRCFQTLHSKYHFYLSFENSLCKDYITEKFWKVLKGDGHYIPVAVGGLSLDDYEAVAPKDSFLHVYNFSSVENLGKYMKSLTQNHTAFNRYHEWRNSYDIDFGPSVACKYCEIANFPSDYRIKQSNIANKNNNRSNCRTL